MCHKKYSMFAKSLDFIKTSKGNNIGFEKSVKYMIWSSFNRKELTPTEYMLLTDPSFKEYKEQRNV